MEKDDHQQSQSEPMLTDESTVLQPDLFSGSPVVITEPVDPTETAFPPLVRTKPLTEQSSLTACFIPYQQDLRLRGKSNYTVTCFLSDLKMFSDYVGRDTQLGVLQEQLTDWLMKLKLKGRVPAPKTMARRVTFLKNFFSG
jgi:integrase/recombinase XerD